MYVRKRARGARRRKNMSDHVEFCQTISHHVCLYSYGVALMGGGWLRLVASMKLQVSFEKEPYKRDCVSMSNSV